MTPVVRELPLVSVQSIDAAAQGSNPYRPGSILEQIDELVVTQTTWIGGAVPEVGESLRFGIELVETIEGADPERAGSVFVNEHDLIRAQAVRIGGVVPVARKPPGVRIEPVESSVPGCDPQNAVVV